MNRSEHQTLEQRRLDETVVSPSAFRVSRLITLAVVLGLIALGLRVMALRQTLSNTLVNPTLLTAAMQAASGTPVSTVAAAEILAGRAPLSGFQARAMSLIAQNAGQWTTAEAWLTQGLADPPSAYLAQFELCLLYWNQGQRDHAREACRDTKASAVFWLNRGYVADQNGERAEALAAFQMASSIDPDLVAAWQQLGHALLSAARHDEAILAYERVMALEATPQADVFYSLSLAYLEANNPTMARDVLNRGLMIYPAERVYYLAMAETYRHEDDLDTAESWYVRMLQRWPYDDQAWAKRGEIAVAAGRLRDAEEYFQEAATIQPNDVGYWINLASVASDTDNVRLATRAYQEAMALRPDDAAIWMQAGRFLAKSGKAGEARSVFEHVLELEPDNRDAMSQLAGLNGLQQ
jgi:tetratricopeptide (TPR) repeat protein